jgi:hypothetical protein
MTIEIYNALCEVGVEMPSFEYYSLNSDVSKDAYGAWVREHKSIYNNLWKINKYNNGLYDKYLSKFIHVDDDGDRTLKATSTVLCLSFYISIILSIFFVIKFPINFFQGRYTGRRLREDGNE